MILPTVGFPSIFHLICIQFQFIGPHLVHYQQQANEEEIELYFMHVLVTTNSKFPYNLSPWFHIIKKHGGNVQST